VRQVKKMRIRNMIIGISLVVLLFLLGCTPQTETQNSAESESLDVGSNTWLDIELKDVTTDETFKVSDFKGKPVLIESFAIWCPTCKKQQQQTMALHEKLGDDFVSIGLDTDPNEDEAEVRGYVEENGFEGFYVVSPVEFTQEIVDEFGVKVVNAPSAPVILVCADQSTRLLKSGLKSTEDLESEIKEGC